MIRKASRETLFKGYYMEWSRKAPLISAISWRALGRCGGTHSRQKGRSKRKVLGQECAWCGQGTATKSFGCANEGQNGRKLEMEAGASFIGYERLRWDAVERF